MFTRGACSPFGVCVLWCWRFGVVVGQCGPAAPAPLAWLVLTSLVWACWRVRWFCVPDGRVGGQVGAGQSCPAPYSVACGARLLRGAERGGRVGGAPRGVLTRAHTRRDGGEGEGEGEPRGADRGGLGGGCGCVPFGACNPWWREREVGVGLRAGLASVRAIVGIGGGGCDPGGDAPSFGCVGDAGGGALPLGGGVGLVVTISLGSVKGGGGVRGGCWVWAIRVGVGWWGSWFWLGVGVWVGWVLGGGCWVSVVGGGLWWLLGLGVFCFVLFVVFWCVFVVVCLFWGWLVGLWWGWLLCGVVRGCVLLFGGWLACGWGFGLGFGLFVCWVVGWVVVVRLVFRMGCVGSVGGMAWGVVLVAMLFVRGWCSCWWCCRRLCSGCGGWGGLWFGWGWCWCMVVGLV